MHIDQKGTVTKVSIDQQPPILATCWTSAGNAQPQSSDERSPLPLRDRVTAVANAGYRGMGIVYDDLLEFLKSNSTTDLKNLLDDHALRFREVEFLTNWWMQGAEREASDRMRKQLFEIAAEIGAQTVKVAPVTEGEVDASHFAAEFDRLGSEAAGFGTRIAIEPLPFSINLPRVEDAIRLVKEVANPAAGLCIDIWHVVRGGTSYETLERELPADYLFVVELDDAAAEPVGTLWEDTVHNRLLPGHGAFEVSEFVRVINSVGFDGPWGVEIISKEHRALPLDEALARTHEATVEVLRRS